MEAPLTNGVVANGIHGETDTVDLVEYLYCRLHQIGIRSVHGVPGDYNLIALDYLPKAGLNWVGSVNELNAGYAADGYARVKGMSALITTFGVGELSALNAIAGAYSEYIPVIHIVGTPSTLSQSQHAILHHSLGDGDYHAFPEMSRYVSCAITNLNDPLSAPAMIDDIIRTCYLQSRPVYIGLPSDMVTRKVEAKRLKTPIDLSIPQNDEQRETHVVDVVLKLLQAAKRPALLVDILAIRRKILDEIHEFVVRFNIPVYVTPMGKGSIDETLPHYQGVYVGVASDPNVRESFESLDLLLSVGLLQSDINMGGFTSKVNLSCAVEFHTDKTVVGFSEYPGVGMNGILHRLVQTLDRMDITSRALLPATKRKIPKGKIDDQLLMHDWFWPKVTEYLRNNDVVVTEAGTSNFGIWDSQFKRGTKGISSLLWSSIGYSLGACQGAALAVSEMTDVKRRTVLFIGDGSFQLTAQELSTIIRQGLTPTIFIICNNGFAIERYVHGMTAPYNDIQQWNFSDLLAAFGAKRDTYKTYKAMTRADVHSLFNDERFCSAKCLQLVEVYLPWDDAPKSMKLLAASAAKRNAKH